MQDQAPRFDCCMSTETRIGRVAFPANDRYLWDALADCGDYCLNEMEAYSSIIKPGATVLDVGANIGMMSILFSTLVGRLGKIYAFEPSVFVGGLLTYNIALNGCGNVSVHRQAVSDYLGVSEFLDPDSSLIGDLNFGGISLSSKVRKNYGRMVETPVITVDSLELDACDFIKIDVEGYEAAVIRGARNTIEKFLPFISLEADNPRHDLSWISYLLSLDYRVFVSKFHIFTAQNFKKRDISHLESVFCLNAIAVPRHSDHKTILRDLPRVEVKSLERLRAVVSTLTGRAA